mmetsp:Transcript_6895/g.15848  ORF Transcript_6895/g.15848 Transcript_6895/m.15848 type:complete len:188 (-) Transcript_6895:1085-1648(-)
MPVEDDAEDFRIRVRTAQRFLCLHIFLLYILKMLLPMDTFSSYSYDTALRITIISRYIFVCMSNAVDIQLLDMSPNIGFHLKGGHHLNFSWKRKERTEKSLLKPSASSIHQPSLDQFIMTKIYRPEKTMIPDLSPRLDSYVIELSSNSVDLLPSSYGIMKPDTLYFVVRMNKLEYDIFWSTINPKPV